MNFSEARDVKKIARDLINKHHKHLANAPMYFLFDSETKQSKGKEILGEMKLISGLNAFLITKDDEDPAEKVFVMVISKQAWDLLENHQHAREALVDHELCHALVDDAKLSLVPHDIEEFNDVARRHGQWRSDISNFIKAAKENKTPMLPFDIGIARERSIAAAEAAGDTGDGHEEKTKAAVSVTIRRGRRAKGQDAAVGE